MAKKIGGLNKAKGLDALISGGRRAALDAINDPVIRKAPVNKEAEASAENSTIKEEKAKTVVSKTPVAAKAKPETKAAESKKSSAKAEETKKSSAKAEESRKPEAKPEAANKPAAKTDALKKPTAAQEALNPSVANSEPQAAPAQSSAVTPAEPETDENSVIHVKISSVVPNKEQPRKQFSEEGLAELSASIRQYGVIVPLIVLKKGKYYEIIAGERRWRAAKMAGVKEIPVIVREYTDSEAAEIALIENIQREDLNAIEEANAYSRLIEEFNLTQEEVALKVAKSRTAITNSLRLLKLDARVQKLLIDEMLTMGHARALLAIENPDAQFDTANVVILRKMSVRETESYVKRLLRGPRIIERPDTLQLDVLYEELEENLKAILGTKTKIHRKNGGKGSIEIEFYSQDELERLMKMIRSINMRG